MISIAIRAAITVALMAALLPLRADVRNVWIGVNGAT